MTNEIMMIERSWGSVLSMLSYGEYSGYSITLQSTGISLSTASGVFATVI